MSVKMNKMPFRQLLAPLLSTVFLILCTGYYMTFVSLRLKLEGFSDTTLAYVHSAYFCGALLAGIGAERLVRRIGHGPSFGVFAFVSLVMVLIQGLFADPALWMTARMVAGICFGGLWIIAESWFLLSNSEATRGRLISLYMTVYYAAVSLSQFILTSVDTDTSTSIYLAGIVCFASVLPVSFIHAKVPLMPEPSQKGKTLTLWSAAPLGFFASLFGGLMESVFYCFVPSYALAAGISVSLILCITIAGGLLLQWPIGQLSDRFDRRRVIVWVTVVSQIASVCIVLFAGYAAPVLLFAFLLGGALFTIYPVSVAQICDGICPRDTVAVTGLLLIAYEVGTVTGPSLVSFCMETLVPTALYGYFALVAAAILGVLSCAYWLRVMPPARTRHRMDRIVRLPIESAELTEEAEPPRVRLVSGA